MKQLLVKKIYDNNKLFLPILVDYASFVKVFMETLPIKKIIKGYILEETVVSG